MMQKEVIVLFTGGIKTDAQTGAWRTLLVGEGEAGGFCNDRWRVEAAVFLWARLQCPIVVCGGPRNTPECP